ncbi:hypothetical protein O181_076258 [Austropuccinia psidii MF-1]|uniref:Uncharacterized protein n=1 Tax=Austropuccinia psidii MF-1 TaxID=1389203 RepID=A0A9Q3ICM0_9BASI|nr:hypothetical protein [Austropuccinia psidii MF-1]
MEDPPTPNQQGGFMEDPPNKVSNLNTAQYRQNPNTDFSSIQLQRPVLIQIPLLDTLRVTPSPKTSQRTQGNTSTGSGHRAHDFSSNLSSNPI